LLDELAYHSKHVRTKFVDFDADRMTAEKLGVSQYGTIVVQTTKDRVDLRDRDVFHRKGKKDDIQLDFFGEAQVTKAMSQLLSATPRVVYTLVGHGEKRFDTNLDPQGDLKALHQLLQNQGYTCQPLDLLRGKEEDAGSKPPAVPDDANAVL